MKKTVALLLAIAMFAAMAAACNGKPETVVPDEEPTAAPAETDTPPTALPASSIFMILPDICSLPFCSNPV